MNTPRAVGKPLSDLEPLPAWSAKEGRQGLSALGTGPYDFLPSSVKSRSPMTPRATASRKGCSAAAAVRSDIVMGVTAVQHSRIPLMLVMDRQFRHAFTAYVPPQLSDTQVLLLAAQLQPRLPNLAGHKLKDFDPCIAKLHHG